MPRNKLVLCRDARKARFAGAENLVAFVSIPMVSEYRHGAPEPQAKISVSGNNRVN
jgi:hypothetical protein